MSKKALFISANHWTSPYRVGTHIIAGFLIREGWQIAFVSEPISPFHFFNPNSLFLKERNQLNKEPLEIKNSLFAYVPFTFLPYFNLPFFNSYFILKNWQRFSFPNAFKLINEKGFAEVDLLYFDTVRQPFWLQKIKYKKSALRIPDYFSGYGESSTAIKKAEKEIAENVDTVFYSSMLNGERISQYKIKEKIYLPNGVDFQKFSDTYSEEPLEYKTIPKPRIIYIGETEKRFDANIIKHAAFQRPDYSFVIIGNGKHLKSSFNNLKNVYTLGTVPYDKLPNYLLHSQAGIIPYNIKEKKELIDFVNPLKLYQYLAAGLPVVAPVWKELELINPPILTYKTPDEFCRQLDNALAQQDKTKLREFASKYDWENILKTFRENIE